jgi:hypothetical protein
MACAFLVWAQSVSAAIVVVVRPASPSAQTMEALTFLHGELSSMALDDTTIERPSGGSPGSTDFRGWLEQLAVERGAFAVIDVMGGNGVSAVDVWVRKSPGRFEVTRVAVDPNTTNASARLAIRALEALRASLLEVDFAARYLRADRVEKQPAPSTKPQAKQSDPVIARQRIGLELGASLFMSPGGVGPAVLPLLRIDWAIHPSLLAQIAAAGLGSKPVVTTATGTALVARESIVLGACYLVSAEQTWSPLLSLAAGALHTSVEGQPSFGMNAHAVDQWSLLADAGLGAAIRLSRSYRVTLSGHVQLTHPYAAIHFGEPVIATTGRPNLLLTLAVGAWL